MYFPYFITYMVMGVGLTLIVFWWALRNGQFQDQNRARFLAVEKEGPIVPAPPSRIHHYEIYALVILTIFGLSASAAVLTFALISGK